MAIDLVNGSTNVLIELVRDVGKTALWLQALGIIVVLWIIIEAITLYFNRKRRKAIYELSDKIDRLEGKIDLLIKKK